MNRHVRNRILRTFRLDPKRSDIYYVIASDSYAHIGKFSFLRYVALQALDFIHISPEEARSSEHGARVSALLAIGLYLPHLDRWSLLLIGSIVLAGWYYVAFQRREAARSLRALPITTAELTRIGWLHVLLLLPGVSLILIALPLIWGVALSELDWTAIPLEMLCTVTFLGITFAYRWIGFTITSIAALCWLPNSWGQLNIGHLLYFFACGFAIIYAIRHDLPAHAELFRINRASSPNTELRSLSDIPSPYPSILLFNARGLLKALAYACIGGPLYVVIVGSFIWKGFHEFYPNFHIPGRTVILAFATLFVVIAISTNSHRERLHTYRMLPISAHRLTFGLWLPCALLPLIVIAVLYVPFVFTDNFGSWEVTICDILLLCGVTAMLALDNVLPLTPPDWVAARLLVFPLLTVFAGLVWLNSSLEGIAAVAMAATTHCALYESLRKSSFVYRYQAAAENPIERLKASA